MTSPQGEVPLDQVLLQTRRDLVEAFQEIYRLQARVAGIEAWMGWRMEPPSGGANVVVASQPDEGGSHVEQK